MCILVLVSSYSALFSLARLGSVPLPHMPPFLQVACTRHIFNRLTLTMELEATHSYESWHS